MNLDDLVLVSVDDHVVEPEGMFEGRVSAKYADRAPRFITREDGTNAWVFEGIETPNIALNAVAGRPPEEYGMEPTALDELRPGVYDIDERVKDMDANGLLGSLCFPSFVQFCGQLIARSPDKDLALAVVQAYNDWHIDEWCGTYPGRFIPCVIPAIWDPEALAAEVRRTARKGAHAVTFSENPHKLGFPSMYSDHWDPFWKACSDEGVVVCLHIGSSSELIITAPDAPIDTIITLSPINIVQAAADLVWSQVLRKFPDLTFALSEGGIGWIPYFLERIDYNYQKHRYWTHQDFGDRLPSDLFKERIVTCFIDDRVGVENRRHLNMDNVTWECDYPHGDSSWPNSPEAFMKQMDGVSDAEIERLSHANAMRIFQYDPFRTIPREQATVRALRKNAEGHDVSTVSRARRAASASTSAVDLRRNVASRSTDS
ncbi:MAG: amidohydrolase [Actinomycetota bacterium]|nr:amidohydrolase [Actinomycetota bacterium]